MWGIVYRLSYKTWERGREVNLIYFVGNKSQAWWFACRCYLMCNKNNKAYRPNAHLLDILAVTRAFSKLNLGHSDMSM